MPAVLKRTKRQNDSIQSCNDERTACSIWITMLIAYIVSAEKVIDVKEIKRRPVKANCRDGVESDDGSIRETAEIQE